MDGKEAAAGALVAVDYVIIGLFLAISAAIGVYFRFSGGKQKTTNVLQTIYISIILWLLNESRIHIDVVFWCVFFQEYLLAGGNMPMLPVAFSLMASFMSSITLLGVSSENYLYGTQFVIINLSYMIGTPIAAYFYLPVFYQLQNASVYQVVPLFFSITLWQINF